MSSDMGHRPSATMRAKRRRDIRGGGVQEVYVTSDRKKYPSKRGVRASEYAWLCTTGKDGSGASLSTGATAANTWRLSCEAA